MKESQAGAKTVISGPGFPVDRQVGSIFPSHLLLHSLGFWQKCRELGAFSASTSIDTCSVGTYQVGT